MIKLLRVLGTIILCIGIVASFLVAYHVGQAGYSYYTGMDLGSFLGILIAGLFLSAVSSCWFFFCAGVLEKLDRLISLQEGKKD